MAGRALGWAARFSVTTLTKSPISHYVSQSLNRQARSVATESTSGSQPLPKERSHLPGSIKKLNRLLGRQRLSAIPEHELKESFVRGELCALMRLMARSAHRSGSGPGGQAINKTSSSVSLIHLPSGIRVQAQPTRSREANRKAARRILAEKLDYLKVAAHRAPDESETQLSKSEEKATVPTMAGSCLNSKEARKEEEVLLAESWTRAEIQWEKERRRKANRAKKVKRKRQDSSKNMHQEPG
jgi:hypothetical protein